MTPFILPIVATLFLGFSCSEQTSDRKGCENVRNGRFMFHYRIEQKDLFQMIERRDSLQLETDKETGYYTKLSIKWTDDCTYEALMVETTFPFPDSIQQIRRTIPFKTQILKVTKDYYTFESQRGNFPIISDTMWIEK